MTDLLEMSYFQKMSLQDLREQDVFQLLRQPHFFQTPKPNDVTRRQHSHYIDLILGFKIKEIEEELLRHGKTVLPQGNYALWGPKIHNGTQTWVGLDSDTLQTPYSELLRILHLLKTKPGQIIIDLGAAYGRLGIIMSVITPQSQFIGYEYVKERVDEGNRIYERLDLSHASMIRQDLIATNFEIPEADIYFIYDYGKDEHIDKTLRHLQDISEERPIKLVVRGLKTRALIQDHHDWLEPIYEGQKEEMFIIYRSHFHQ